MKTTPSSIFGLNSSFHSSQMGSLDPGWLTDTILSLLDKHQGLWANYIIENEILLVLKTGLSNTQMNLIPSSRPCLALCFPASPFPPSSLSEKYLFWDRSFLSTLFKGISHFPSTVNLCYMNPLYYPPVATIIWICFVFFLLMFYGPHPIRIVFLSTSA